MLDFFCLCPTFPPAQPNESPWHGVCLQLCRLRHFSEGFLDYFTGRMSAIVHPCKGSLALVLWSNICSLLQQNKGHLAMRLLQPNPNSLWVQEQGAGTLKNELFSFSPS